MSNSIVDNDYAHSFGSNFDDGESALSADREDFLLVLVSSLSGSTSQGRNQKRALTILEACGVHPEVLDAADPANSLVRDELCEMSGVRGAYPQFFLVQGDRTSFFADFAELEHMNEEGTLAEWLSMELPIANLSSKNKQVNQREDRANANATANNDDRSHVSRSDSMQAGTNIESCGVEANHEYAASSNTEDFLNVTSVSKILNSFEINNIVPDKRLQQEEPQIDGITSEAGGGNKSMIVSIPTTSTNQDEWSDPMLLERYADEILALEDYLQEREEKEGDHYGQQEGAKTKSIESKRKLQLSKYQKKVDYDNRDSDVRIDQNQNLLSGKKENNNEKARNDGQHFLKDKCNSESSLSSTSTTATAIATPSPSPSQSQSPGRDRVHKNSAVNVNSPTAPSPSPIKLIYHTDKNNDKEMSCNGSMEETISSRTETEQLLQAEVADLRRKCEKLTAERYIMEGQLKEARQRNRNDEHHASDPHNIGTVHKYQLQQTMRCAYCTEVFKSIPSSLNAPIASQSCGHSICRNCCHKRLSSVRRRRDENAMNSSERLRKTISNDLFMCGMGNMSQVYSPSFEEHERQLQECESCPICHAPSAFRQGKLHVNESLCIVLKLLDN